MKEQPLSFADPMVLGVLDGSKTMTRRLVNRVLRRGVVSEFGRSDTPGYDWHFRDKMMRWHDLRHADLLARCPYGVPGDRLWVKETWRVGAWNEDDGQIAVDYRADGYSRREWLSIPETVDPDGDTFNRLWEQSTIDAERVHGDQERYSWEPGQSPCRWRPSMFMPRWAARIVLEVTDVRVERVQDISEDDAVAEGVCTDPAAPARDGFMVLWDSIYSSRGAGWDANPWVWVVSFRRVI